MLFFSNERIPKQIMCTLSILKHQIMFLLNCGVCYLKDAEDNFFCEMAVFPSPWFLPSFPLIVELQRLK